jgi:hypothetical protein
MAAVVNGNRPPSASADDHLARRVPRDDGTTAWSSNSLMMRPTGSIGNRAWMMVVHNQIGHKLDRYAIFISSLYKFSDSAVVRQFPYFERHGIDTFLAS